MAKFAKLAEQITVFDQLLDKRRFRFAQKIKEHILLRIPIFVHKTTDTKEKKIALVDTALVEIALVDTMLNKNQV